MAIGTAAAIGLGAAALGGFLNTRSQNKAAKQQTQYNQQQAQQMQNLMRFTPGAAESQLAGFARGLQAPQAYDPQQVGAPGFTPEMANVQGMLSGSGFNTGQDALMQALRSDPTAQSNRALQGIIEGRGNPFDTTEMFRALGVIDQRNTDQAVAQVRAGASGLGQRFGSYMARQEADMRTRANESAAARNAAIQMQSYADAQQRLLASIGQLGQNEQFRGNLGLQAGLGLQQGGLGAAGLQLQGVQANNQAQQALAALTQQGQIANQQAGLQAAGLNQQGLLTTQAQQLAALQGMGGLEQGRAGLNAQLAGMAAGAGVPVAGPGWGSFIGGLGSAIMAPGILESTRPPAPNINIMALPYTLAY